MDQNNGAESHQHDKDTETISLAGLDLIWARYYASIVLPFRTRPGLSQADIVKTLQDSLELMCRNVPVFTGRVFEKPATTQQPAEGQRELRERSDWIPQVIHHNMMNGTLDYDDLEEAGFPPNAFDAKALMPQDSAASAWVAPSAGAPVIIVQANFIKGGLLLASRVHHAVADGTGVSLFLKNWAFHTRLLQESSSTSSNVSMTAPSHNRHMLHSYWKEQGEPIADTSDPAKWRLLGLLPPPGRSELPPPHPEMEGRLFYVSADSFKALTRDGQQETASGDVSRANGNDIVSALLWRSTIRARKESGGPNPEAEYANEESSTLDTVVNGRAFVGKTVPYDYVANMVLFASSSMTIGDLLNNGTTLATLSDTIHDAATSITMEQALAAYGLATTISDYRYMPYAFGHLEGTEVFINSWMALQIDETSFGDLFLNNGCPDSSRPLHLEYGGYARRIVALPINSQGGFEILVEMLAAEIEALQSDEEFTRYAQLMC